MTDQKEVPDHTPGDDLLAEAKEAKISAEILVEKYRKILDEVNRRKLKNHIFAKMIETLGG